MASEAEKPRVSSAETIFAAALAMSPAERVAYLIGACADDEQLRRRVEALLRAHEAPEGFLPEIPGTVVGDSLRTNILAASFTEPAGDTIGRYRLGQKIGEGGCGVVYMAEQEAPVRRKVALKIIKLGMDTKQVVARFEAERQALALMDHANIAKVLDAGATETGRPYFVMELVAGIKITDYCDRNQLTTRQRLDLFIQVCGAIQHAHQKGVIHRDIKPSNVLVATQDGASIPKVIDFGIAKATQGRLTNQTVFTAFEQFLGTPAYMSPEQAQLGGQDVDTRSDIYSLGVLLYELLTGKTPFDTQAMAGGLDEIRRTIREKKPARPSTRLSTMEAGELKNAAERRMSEAARLIHGVRGDIDWIVMKCLEKERARRYETASGLASDVQRHLNNEPVRARPPSKLYEFQKTVRRHKFGFAATAAIIVALSCGIVATSLQAVRARRAEREAQTARKDATEKLWASYLSEARGLRVSGQSGRHFESLAVLRKAAAIRPSLALRNEAIGSMILPDIHRVERKDFNKAREKVFFESTLENYAVRERTGAVSIRHMADDREVARLPDVVAAATGIWFLSPDGRFLVVPYADGQWRVWDWAKPAIVAQGQIAGGAAFSPDGHSFADSDGTNIVLHDLVSGGSLKSISFSGLTSKSAPDWFRFDPAGRRLALHTSDSDTNIMILDIQTGETLKTLRHVSYVWDVAWHPEGKLLATGCASPSPTIHIWDSTSGERLRMWRTETCISLAFNHKGNVLASSGWDGYTRLWEFETWRELSSVYRSGHILHFSTDDLRLATDGWDATVLDFHEVAYGQGLRTLHEAPVVSGGWACSPVTDKSRRLLAFRTHEGIELWNLQTGGQISRFGLEKDKSLIGFDAGCQNLILTGREGLFRCPIAGSGEDFGIVSRPILVNTECADHISGRQGWMSENGKVCATVANNRCQMFRTDTFEKQAETGVQPGMRFSDINWDGSLFASGAWHYPGVKVWNTQTGSPVKDLPTGDESATVAFSPDRHHLVTATTYEYCIWEVGSWSLVRRIQQDPDSNFFPMMAFTRDGKILAGTFARHKVRLYDFATCQVLADLEAPNAKDVTGLAFNQDGTQLFIAEAADAVRVWDLRLIRQQLAGLGLDWDQPPFPPAAPAMKVPAERAASH